MSKSYDRECAYCGAEFTAHDVRRIYCCDTCKDNASKERHGIAPVVIHKKICPGCGKEFETQYRRKVYCRKACNGKPKSDGSGERECIICKKIFITCHNAKTCGNDECKKAAKRERSKHWKKSVRHPRLITYETRECVECGKPFKIDDRLSNVCCSTECSKKHKNRKVDKRIPKNQIVDSDISLQRLFKRDNGICWICGGMCDFNSKAISKKGNVYCGDLYPEIEHVIPISRGGLHSWNNVRLAHRKCNQMKSDNLFPFVPLDKKFAYKEKRKGTQAKRTAQYSLDGELIRIWDSTAQIGRELGFNEKHIQSVCRGYKSNTGNAYGFHWEYLDD